MRIQPVLCALLLRGPSYGYELLSTLEAELGSAWSTPHTSIYLALGRLQRDSFIRVTRIPQRGRPTRQLLKLTSMGNQLADDWLADPGPATEMAVKLAIARLVRPTWLEDLASAMISDRSAAVARLRSLRGGGRGGFEHEAIELQIATAKAELRWVSLIRDRAHEIVAKPVATHKAETVEEERQLA